MYAGAKRMPNHKNHITSTFKTHMPLKMRCKYLTSFVAHIPFSATVSVPCSLTVLEGFAHSALFPQTSRTPFPFSVDLVS